MRPVTGLSDGWAEGVRQMVVGEKRTLWVPAALAPHGRPGTTPIDVTMVVELLESFPDRRRPPT